MPQSQFQLEVYEPGSTTTVVGQVLRTGAIDRDALPSAGLRVTRVEHGLFMGESGVLRHKLMLFTEPE